jgi:hypothetical protein
MMSKETSGILRNVRTPSGASTDTVGFL